VGAGAGAGFKSVICSIVSNFRLIFAIGKAGWQWFPSLKRFFSCRNP
jgi:hypothetical protein